MDYIPLDFHSQAIMIFHIASYLHLAHKSFINVRISLA